MRIFKVGDRVLVTEGASKDVYAKHVNKTGTVTKDEDDDGVVVKIDDDTERDGWFF